MRWLLGAIVLLVIGMALELGLLVYAMYVLIGVMLVSRFLAREWIENVDIKRECNRTTAQIGEKVAVVVTISNQGRIPIMWLLLEDAVPKQALLQRPPRISIEGKRVAILRLPARGKRSMLYQVKFLMRGYYQIGPALIESGDLFGLHRRFEVKTKPQFVLVYPKVLPLQGYNLTSRRPIGEVRLTHRLFEDPTRISGVRAYQRGDAMNRIHWRATARTGELHSKTYEPSCVAGMTILLDAHRAGYSAIREPHLSELAVTAAASLANAIYQMGQQVGFITNGRDASDRPAQPDHARQRRVQNRDAACALTPETSGDPGTTVDSGEYRITGHEFRTRSLARETIEKQANSDRLRPVIVETRRGTEQLTRILETLARVELSDGLTFAQLVIEATSRLPRDATVVALLPEVSPETAIALGSLKRRGYAVTALVVMPEEDDLATQLGRLMAEGIDARCIETEEDISYVCATSV